MTDPRVRILSFLVGMLVGFATASHPAVASPAPPILGEWPTLRDRSVFVVGELQPEDVVTLSAALSASRRQPVLLADSPRSEVANRSFLAAYRPSQVFLVGRFREGLPDVERRLGVSATAHLPWGDGMPSQLRHLLWPRLDRVVVSAPAPRRLLLQAACLAGTTQAPLFVLRNRADVEALRTCLEDHRQARVFAVGDTAAPCRELTTTAVTELIDEASVAAAHRRELIGQGRVQTLVVANPDDARQDRGGMSILAPWFALQRQAALILTNKYGDDVEEVVTTALKERDFAKADNLILAATPQAIPMERRPNPLADGKDPYIEMEPFTPSGFEPYTFAIGRLFHDDPAVVLAILARQRLLADSPPRTLKALVASNSGGGLPLLEAFSRTTAAELRNCGFETTAFYGKQVTCEELRRLLPEQHLFLWEGHHNTLIRDWMFPDWSEPLPPSLMFLQSCLGLSEWKAQPLFQRGAVAVVGSSTRVFSGCGGASSLAFFDALLYDRQSVGGSLRQAKNFLVCYGLLKDKRLGDDSKDGPTLRSAWAFTLWGDPTLMLPKPEPPADALAPVRHRVEGNTIVMDLPKEAPSKVITARYQAQVFPNGRLGGLLRKEGHEDDGQPLVPFVFAEVPLPRVPEGRVPRLKSRLPSNNWVFTWDARRATGYLLAIPRTKDQDEIRFTVDFLDE